MVQSRTAELSPRVTCPHLVALPPVFSDHLLADMLNHEPAGSHDVVL